MMTGGLRMLKRKVYRAWFWGLLMSVLLICVIWYGWKKASFLSHHHQWSSQRPTPFSGLAFPHHRQTNNGGHNSISGREIEEKEEKGNVHQLAFVQDQVKFHHISSSNRTTAVSSHPQPAPHGQPPREASHSTENRGWGLRETGKGGSARESHAESGSGRNDSSSLKMYQKVLHHGPADATVLTNVSDIDVRLLVPRTSVSGTGVAACSPHHHLVFIKVHKAASSTLANIIQRFGFTRQLNFVLPNRAPKSLAYNYISKRGEMLTRNSILSHPPGGHYDLLWNHAIYNRSAFNLFMPRDTVYVSILREPFQQFVSAFAFYNAPHINNIVSLQVNPFSHYLHSMPHPQLLDYFRNKQSEDLGLGPEHVLNNTLRHQYLQQLNQDLQLVMITEFFDESLVLLRRLMCWSVKDILYISKNRNSFKPTFVFSSHDYARHRELSAADYDLYRFFKHKFLRTLAAQDVDFEHEVTHFKEVLRKVHGFCERSQLHSQKRFFVPRSPWSSEFSISSQDCLLLVMSELTFLDKLLEASTAKVQQSSFTADGIPYSLSPQGHLHNLPLPS